MPEDKSCRKCGKKESKSEMAFVSVYGLCNECHMKFLPLLSEALNKFLKTRKGTGKKSWITRKRHLSE
jgi:hypothetical protein